MGRPKGSKNKEEVVETVKVDEIVVEQGITQEPPTPTVEYHAQPEKIEIPKEEMPNKYVEKFTPDENKLLVDKRLFYKMFKMNVQGYSVTKHAAVAKYGAMLGATTQEECKAKWDECQKYLSENKQ